MEILELLQGIVNFGVGIVNGFLDLIETLFSPIINLIERWNNLFGEG